MENTSKHGTDISQKHYGYSQRDITDEITNTLAWLYENHKLLALSTITAYLQLLFNLTSLVTEVTERQKLFGVLIDFENINQYQVKLHI